MDYRSNLQTLKSKLETDSKDNSEPSIKEKKDYFSDMESFMDRTVVNMYSRTWGRLEKKLKINKINEFLIRVTEENSLDQEKNMELTDFVMNLLTMNKINKATEIKYDREKCEIVEIFGLKFKPNNFEYQRKKK